METPPHAAYACIIDAVPKELCRCKVQRLLERHLGAATSERLWRIERVARLEHVQLLHVTCDTVAVCERLLQISDNGGGNVPWRIRLLPPHAAYPPAPSAAVAAQPSLLQLNVDCMRHIIAQSRLKQQLVWAQVSHLCLDLVIDCWRQRYATLHFDLHRLEFVDELSVAEIGDFCALVGEHVRHLIFNSIFYFPLLQRHLRDRPGNLMQNAKRYINMRLCQQLCHFPQLRVFEVQGKFLSDFTLRELARHCQQLRVCRLLDAGTRWLRGKHLQHFRCLQQLELKDCEALGRRALRRVCVASPALHTLNVVECLELYRSAYFEQHLCTRLQQLRQLHMTAIANGRMLQAVLDLPALREVHFYWLNEFAYFEGMLYAMLQQNGRSVQRMCALEFHTERIYVDNESQEHLSAAKYARMRELNTLSGRAWCMADGYQRIVRMLGAMQALATLRCHYCRPFDGGQLLRLSEACPTLCDIELLGCREAGDAVLQQQFHSASKCCELRVVDGMSLEELQALRQDHGRRRSDAAPVMRRIVCRFS